MSTNDCAAPEFSSTRPESQRPVRRHRINEFLHHVPGRVRIRARLFLGESRERAQALRRLRVLPGVRDLRLNAKAGSVTVYYDTNAVSGTELLQRLRRECPQATLPRAPLARPRASFPMTPRPIAAEIGRVALGMLVNKGVSYSLSTLLRTRF